MAFLTGRKAPIRTIRGRIIFLACGLTLVTTYWLGTLIYDRTEAIALDSTIEALRGEARLVTERATKSLDRVLNDVVMLSLLPAVEGIARAERSNGIDPADGSSLVEWKGRMQSIFASLLANRDAYFQIRFIDASADGREIVRVERRAGGVAVVRETELSGHVPDAFFRPARDLEEGQTYLSRVTLQHEFGVPNPKRIPIVNAVQPVFYEGTLLGMVVIGAEYEDLLARPVLAPHVEHDILVFNNVRDAFGLRVGQSGIAFQSGTPEQVLAGYTEAKSSAPGFQEFYRVGDDTISYAVEAPVDVAGPFGSLLLILSEDSASVLGPVYALRKETLVRAGLILLVALVLGVLAARRIARPLDQLADHVTRLSDFGELDALPVDASGEVGQIARSYKSLAENLRTSQSRAEVVLDNIADGVISVTTDGKILGANPAAAEIFGRSRSELESISLADVLPDIVLDEAGLPEGELRSLGRDVYAMRTRWQAAGGALEDIELTIGKLQGEPCGSHRIWVIRNITEAVRIERAKEEFVSTVSHELRTPLSVVVGALGLLHHTAGRQKLDEKERKLLESASRNADRLSLLINDVLDFEKLSAGQMEFDFDEVEVRELVRDVVSQHQSLAEEKSLTLKLDLDPEPVVCRIDRARMTQALVNLLSNAIKFSPQNEAIQFQVHRDGDGQVRISVRDHGPGISESFRKRIFQRFARAERNGKPGTGLGLAITKSIVEAHDGDVGFETELGKGTVFHITLPLYQPADDCPARSDDFGPGDTVAGVHGTV
ncbi:ATP-binding protein [Pseudoruegeria sp. HB172150]|uniref:HAMP domain-containing sensor histidine kinase n=1 Tax=Pseudoruegeria sp. HB172150 TaxID=2721164 RepID=UPI001556A6F9|nr:ATP-binding protein [Pseudoruegeria sp. HB172150]